MALIAVAADKGAPGVTTASLALAAVWPRPVLLAEADPSGGDLIYRLPSADGGRLDPRRGLLSLAVAARRGIHPQQVWEHTQKLNGGLDILTGVGNAEQAGGLQLLWGKIGQVLAGVPDLDVVADCGRLGMDGPFCDLLGHASAVVLVARPDLEGVVRLRHRAVQVAAALAKRGQPRTIVDVVIVADYKQFRSATAEVASALDHGNVPARVVGGLAYEPKSAELLRGEWGGKLDKSMLIRTAREIAAQLVARLPVLGGAAQPAGPQRPPVPSAGPQRPPASAGGQRPHEPSAWPQRPPEPSVAQQQQPPVPSPGPQRPPAPSAGQPRRPASAEERQRAPVPPAGQQRPAGPQPQDQRPRRPMAAGSDDQPSGQPSPEDRVSRAGQRPGAHPAAVPQRDAGFRAAQPHQDRLAAGPPPPQDQLVAGGRLSQDQPDDAPGRGGDAPAPPAAGQQRPSRGEDRTSADPHGGHRPAGPGQAVPGSGGRG